MNRKALLGLLVLCGFLAAPADAQDAAGVAAGWGLLGTWAIDCGAAPSRENAHLGFVREGGRLLHRRNFGDLHDQFDVTAAKTLPDGSIEVVLDLTNFGQMRTVVFAKAGEGKKRAILNRSDKGDYSIRHGKFVANGVPTPILARCAALPN